MGSVRIHIGQTNFDVEFDVGNPWRGSRDKFGVPLEPDEPGEVVINSITSEGELIDLLSDKVVEMIQQETESNAWEYQNGYMD